MRAEIFIVLFTVVSHFQEQCLIYSRCLKNICWMNVSLEAHGDVQERTLLGAVVTRFLSLFKKEFKNYTDAGKQHREFIEAKEYPWKGSAGEHRDWVTPGSPDQGFLSLLGAELDDILLVSPPTRRDSLVPAFPSLFGPFGFVMVLDASWELQ